MSRISTASFAAACAMAAAGNAQADVPSVAVDIGPVHSLVARVMEGVGEPALVMPPGGSPHGHAMRPSEARALQDADLVFWVGPELTPWLGEAAGTLARDARMVALLGAPGSTVHDLRDDALFPAHDHDDHAAEAGDERAAGADDDHASGADDDHGDPGASDHAEHADGARDPHAWLDPGNAMAWLDTIAAELAAEDPGNADAYRANAADAASEMETVVSEIDALLDPVRGRGFVVFHDAYQYFERAFDMPASGAISLSDAARPGPARLEAIRGRVAEADVSCVLAEPQFDPDLVATVLDGTEARSAVIDPLGATIPPGPSLYPLLLRELGRSLADCL